MRLYEINQALSELLNRVNPDTGEIEFSSEEYEALQLQREQKLEGMAIVIKGLVAEEGAIREEIATLTTRCQRIEKHRESLRRYLQEQLGGEKMETPRVAISYRSSEVAEIGDTFWAHPDPQYLREAKPQPDKAKIKTALKQGIQIEGATLVKKSNMIIK